MVHGASASYRLLRELLKSFGASFECVHPPDEDSDQAIACRCALSVEGKNIDILILSLSHVQLLLFA